jgi:hypothetical protein
VRSLTCGLGRKKGEEVLERWLCRDVLEWAGCGGAWRVDGSIDGDWGKSQYGMEADVWMCGSGCLLPISFRKEKRALLGVRGMAEAIVQISFI